MSSAEVPSTIAPSSRALANLCRQSTDKALDPLSALDLEAAPPADRPWMTESLVSLHGTPYYDELEPGQRVRLSQLEFSLFCSISCSGEKEVIANVARLMLKRRFEPYRRYIFHFLREENNHIYMFSEFCQRHGRWFPVLYPYAQGELWGSDQLADLMTFVHVFVFEELGQGMNEVMMRDPELPPLIRALNRYHVLDEARHISFGRHLIGEIAPDLVAALPADELARLQGHLARYIASRHIDYHNLAIYRAVGVRDPARVREAVIASRGVGYFARSPRAERRVRAMLAFLTDLQLIAGPPALMT